MTLTGLAPVMGALAMGQHDLVVLCVLFVVGCLGHTYGFTQNDIVDVSHDRSVKEIASRPLVKGTISISHAKSFAYLSLVICLLLAFTLSLLMHNSGSFVVFLIPVACVTLYNYISKRYAYADLLLAFGMFCFILWGALVQASSFQDVSLLAWVLCFLGAIQVLYMNIVAGGLKDIKHDREKKAQTTAIHLGVHMNDTALMISVKFALVAYVLQVLNIAIAFLPVLLNPIPPSNTLLPYLQISVLVMTSIGMLVFVYRLLRLKQFERRTVRRLIGFHYYLNFCLAPLLLLSISLWAVLLLDIPAIGFVVSNLVLHEKLMEPEVM